MLYSLKADGSLKLCVNYKELNKLSQKNNYPLPRIDILFDHLGVLRYSHRLELAMGFHQHRVVEVRVPKTAFHTLDGSFD